MRPCLCVLFSLLLGACAGRPPRPGAAATPADRLLALTADCPQVVSAHSYALDNGRKVPICARPGAVYWTADMDIDCDGRPTANKCGPEKRLDCCFQPDTSLHNGRGEPLAAAETPYVVIPRDFSYPGLTLGTVVAVVYQGRLQFAVFGDTGPKNIIGEASYACAEQLGIPPSAVSGGVQGKEVTYVAFVGEGTVPRDVEDQAETRTLGEALLARLLGETH
jgi:hypothetical protein